MKKIFLFGDSLTQYSFNPQQHGWGAALCHYFARRADVVPRGYSGYNSEWCKYLIDSMISEFPREQNDLLFCTILLGSNDCAFPHSVQHVDLETYNKNLIEMIEKLRKYDENIRIVLIIPPPILDAKWEKINGEKLDRNIQSVSPYRDVCMRIAPNYPSNVVLYDTWDAFGTDEHDLEEFLNDGLHFDVKGNERFFQDLVKVIDSFLDVAALDLPFPLWRDVDPKRLPDSLYK